MKRPIKTAYFSIFRTQYRKILWQSYVELYIVGSMDLELSQQLQMWFSEHFSAQKLAAWFVDPIVSATVEQNWREKMFEKPHSTRLLR